MNENRWLAHRAVPLVLAALVLIVLIPYSASFVYQHPDERHYRDGGVIMLESGDWLTPKTAEGRTRLKKPVPAYWVSAAGMAIRGPGIAGSRMVHL